MKIKCQRGIETKFKFFLLCLLRSQTQCIGCVYVCVRVERVGVCGGGGCM